MVLTRRVWPRTGFTLIEMLATIAIISLLIALLLPSLSGMRESAQAAECASNLHQLRALLQANPHEDGSTFAPPAGLWIDHVVRKGGPVAKLLCPKDSVEFSFGSIAGWYLYQNGPGGNGGAFLSDLTPDQPWVQYQSEMNRTYVDESGNAVHDGNFGESGAGWVEQQYQAATGKTLSGDDFAIGFQNDAAIVIEHDPANGSINIVSLFGPENSNNPRSRHYLAYDEDGDGQIGDYAEEEQLRLAGKDNTDPANFPKAEEVTETDVTSYGFNNRIDPNRGGDSASLMMMDYMKHVADWDGNGTDVWEEQLPAFRHYASGGYGKANVLRVDGSVTLMTPEQVFPPDHPDLWNAGS